MTNPSTFIFTLAATDDGEFITVLAPGRKPLPADDSHVNFDQIKALCLDSLDGKTVDADEVCDLFDVAEVVERKFQRLTERIAVAGGIITLDGDPVHGTLQDQILDFLDAGEDFGPLVNFYEKLATNPLGDVREGLYDWIVGQRESGTLTITPSGDVIGYKSVGVADPEWRDGEGQVYIPSRRGPGAVNGLDVPAGKFIEQRDGDVVEMPRSKVLYAPSEACGDGLHIGTYGYASTFRAGAAGSVVLLVKFNPRDIVSLPDSTSSWKLRVCRYTVIGECDEPLDTPLYITEAEAAAAEAEASEQGLDLDLAIGSVSDAADAAVKAINDANTVRKGDRVVDPDGDYATVGNVDPDGGFDLDYEDEWIGTLDAADHGFDSDDLTIIGDLGVPLTNDEIVARRHGKGGATSQAAKGRGRNAAQDEKGRFSAGRPGSQRDGRTGRFAG